MSDKISVIVPIYKIEGYVEKCIDSIISQTYGNLEIILVNDGSPDNCGKICDDYAKKDPRIKVIHKENGGLSDARNAGLDMSTGKFISFVDGDDYLEVDFIETLYNLIKEHDADVSMVTFNDVRNGEVTPYLAGDEPELKMFDSLEALKCLLIDRDITSHVWNKFYKAELFEGVRFPYGKVFEDVRVMPQIFKKIKRLVYFNVPKINYVYRDTSILGAYDPKKQRDCAAVLAENFKYLEGIEALDQYRCYNFVIWMIRNYKFPVLANEPDLSFLEEHLGLLEEAYKAHREYIYGMLPHMSKIILHAMLWDLEKGREVVKVIHL